MMLRLALLVLLRGAHGLLPSTVVVAGATGRTGRLVVERLVERFPNTTVRAFVRDEAKAAAVLPPPSARLEIVRGDLASARGVAAACAGDDVGAIWCATGFSDAPSSALNKLRGLFGVVVQPRRSIDIAGVGAFARALGEGGEGGEGGGGRPRLVMLSSAGVTRPEWDEDTKAALAGAADIPIVRLNPFGILGKKVEAEDALRASGVAYSIVRPCGLNDEWPAGRPILSQGDVAVGRTCRADVADVLVAALGEPAAARKTFEMLTLRGYEPPRSLAPALARLAHDGAPRDAARVAAEYALLQQLLPGEAQDATQLEMGRTYEQVDRGEVAPRESGAAPTTREADLAATVSG